MKLFKIITLAFFALTFTACSDDDSVGSSDSLIEGTWQMTDIDYTGETEISSPFLEDNILQTFIGTAKDIDYSLTFDNGQISGNGMYTIELETMTLGITSTDEVVLTTTVGDGSSYTVVDDILTTTSNGEVADVTIVTLTSNILVLNIKDVQTNNDVSQSSTSTIDVTYMFAK